MRSSLRVLGVAAGAPLLVAALAGCGAGSSSASAASPASATDAAPSGAAPSAQPSAARAPGVSGRTAAISGDTLQVQGTDGQTAVLFSTGTRITELRAAARSAVVVGSCVSASGPVDAAGTGLSAQLVAVSPASGGSCTADAAGRGAGGGGFRAPRTGGPSGSSGQPSGATASPVGTAFGTVTAVSASSITVRGQLRSFVRGQGNRPGASSSPAAPSGSPSSGSPSSAPTTAVTVRLTGTTSYTSTAVVASSTLAVGQCVTAVGPSNDIGAVTARSITIRPAGPNGCATGTGFGGRRAGGSTSSGAGNG